MQVTETLNEGLKRAYSIKLTANELDTKVNEKLHEAQPDVEMKRISQGQSTYSSFEAAIWASGY